MKIDMQAQDVVIEIVKRNTYIESVPFRFYIAAKTLKEESEITRKKIDRMIFTNFKEREISLSRNQIFSELKRIVSAINKPENLAVSSKVKLSNGRNLHIPMMDFDCEISEDNLKQINEFMIKIGQKGVILESGRSYQYYGLKLMSGKELLMKFLGPCLLFTGYTDCRYIGHQIITGYSSLRISNGGLRPRVPTVISIVQ